MKRLLAVCAVCLVGLFSPLSSLASTCGCSFTRGDANNDGVINLTDAVHILNYLYLGVSMCNLDRGDVDDNGLIQQSDATYLLCVLFGGGGCPPGSTIKPPYPDPGCDCTPDDLEPCCSRSLAAANPTRLAIVSATALRTANSWDLATSGNGTDSVVISTQNNAVCGKEYSEALYDVTWTISDPKGASLSAIADGCVALRTRVKYAADYGLGNACFSYDCPPWVYNELSVNPSEVFVDAEFDFVDPDNPSDTITLYGTGGTYPHDIYYQYSYYEYYCSLQTLYEKNYGYQTAILDSTTRQSIDCMTLKYYTERNTSYQFTTLANPDLVDSEAIMAGQDGFSVKLLYIEYKWCG